MSQPVLDINANIVGTCSACRRDGIRIIAASSLLWKHGPRQNQCVGSYTRPLLGSVQASRIDSSSQPSQQADPPSTDPISNQGADAGSLTSLTVGNLTSLPFTRTHSKILKRIPKGARPQVSITLQNITLDIIRHPNVESKWSCLLDFAAYCLGQPNRGGRSRNLTTLIIKQSIAFADGTHIRLRKDDNETRWPSKPRPFDQSVASRASAKLKGDVKGAVRLLCLNDKLVDPNIDALNQLLPLHPKTPTDHQQVLPSTTPPLQVHPSAVKAAILTFPAGSSGGPDGLRPQHLQDLLTGTSEDDPLLHTITELINLILSGEIPVPVRKTLFGATLLAIGKKDGGLRPIAVGFVWRRLAAKVACRHITDRCATLLSPHQLGMGIAGGAEAAVHAARIFLENRLPNQIMLKIDFKNAFNSIRRDVILEEIKEEFPELLPFAASTLSEPTDLSFGEFKILLEEGAQQGDPLGPAYFCLAIRKL